METKARKLVLEKFHQWIKVFGKKQSERIPTRKVWNHTIGKDLYQEKERCTHY